MKFLANPHEYWASGHLAKRRLALKLAFEERLVYQRGVGFRTPKTTLPFSYLADIASAKVGMAHLRGFEPLTP